VEIVPGGGIATALGRAAVPPREEVERDRWTGEITARVNEHDRALRPTLTIEGTSAALALWLVRESRDGLRDPHLGLDDLMAGLGADHPKQKIREAAEELEAYGLAHLTKYIGGMHVRPTALLFEKLDPQIKGWNPEDDARVLARMAVEAEDIRLRDLEERSGFERRRFNPAASILLSMFDPKDVSGELQPDYPAGYAFLSGGTRAKLRRFVASAEGPPVA
jgi:hypothetical protein